MSHSLCYNLDVHAPEVVLEKMQEILQERQTRILVLDGEIASGKSTFARLLGDRVISMDDFYLPHGEQVYEPVEGHMDLERFEREVLAQLHKETFSYQYFDYHRQVYVPKVAPPGELTIIEGNYSLVKSLGVYYDEAFFLSIDKELQLSRVYARNGPQEYIDFRDLWIPLSEKYFLAHDVRRRCTVYFSMGEEKECEDGVLRQKKLLEER